jgi:hypothetical protein
MYDPTPWESFFVALAGAAAALAGLVFVALSINLARVLGGRGLPERAAEAIVLLSSVLLVALLGLVPGQPARLLGVELLGPALLGWGVPTTVQMRAFRRREYERPGKFASRVVLNQAATLPLILTGVSLFLGWGGGLYWLVPGVILSLVVGLSGAWVFLIEIER